MNSAQKSIRYKQYKSQEWTSHDAEIIVEAPVSLTVNGSVWITFMCTPVSLEALAVGFLLNEGIIQSMNEVQDVRICEHGENIDVWLNHEAKQPAVWRKTSGCTGGVTAVEILAKPNISLSDHSLKIDANEIETIAEMLVKAQVLYRKTGGVHTSILSDGKKILLSAEDIGRHNTLDKIAGLYLMEGLQPQKRILMTTGRISSEMLQKAAQLNVPIVISHTSPSSLSIEMADRYGITLIGYARKSQFNVYTNAQRISNSKYEIDEGACAGYKKKLKSG